MAVSAFLKMCRYYSLMTVTLSIEDLCAFVKQTIPPITADEYAYDEKNMLHQIYYQDQNPLATTCEPQAGEPVLLFHEFIFLLGLIAHNCFFSSPYIGAQLEEFFVEKLNFKRQSTEVQVKPTFHETEEERQKWL